MVQLTVDKANTQIQHQKDNLTTYYNKSDKNTFVRPLDQDEFYAFIGLLCVRDLLRQSMHTYKIIFSETAEHSVFSPTI